MIIYSRTNRQFNLGLVAAAVVALLAIGWIVVATRMAADDIGRSQAEGTARFGHLAEARILAPARTDETLELIAHGDITKSEASFNAHLNELTAQRAPGRRPPVCGTGPPATTSRSKYLDGDYPGAVAQASVPTRPRRPHSSPTSSPSARPDRTNPRRAAGRVSSAGAWLSWSPTGTLVLMVLAAAAPPSGCGRGSRSSCENTNCAGAGRLCPRRAGCGPRRHRPR